MAGALLYDLNGSDLTIPDFQDAFLSALTNQSSSGEVLFYNIGERRLWFLFKPLGVGSKRWAEPPI